MDFHAHLDVVEEVAAGCGSSGWCLGVLQIHSWIAGLLSEQAQKDIYDDDPDALIAAVLNPRGKARKTDGGYVVEGFWPFGSGSEHSSWMILGAQLLDDDHAVLDEGCFLIPATDIEIKDDWRVAGLRGHRQLQRRRKGGRRAGSPFYFFQGRTRRQDTGCPPA
jgi:3-hydroxy-9,10-secoandrosta-1,3,5(10)-triene-9,17-dione monooxygenase